MTEKYRGSAHNTCNISFRLSNKIPIIFYNLGEYVDHLIMQEIGKFNKTINVIPNNIEGYVAFMISDLVFIDSFQFINSSLSDLGNNLSKESFHHAKNVFNSGALELIIKKESIPMITWMVLDDSTRSYRRKMNPILNSLMTKLATFIMNMPDCMENF